MATDDTKAEFRLRDPERLKNVRVLRYDEKEEFDNNTPYLLRKKPVGGGFKFISLFLGFLTLLAFSMSLLMALFTSNFETEFNASRGKTSLFASVEYGVFCIMSIFMPFFYDMMDQRIFVAIAYISLSIGLFVPSFINNFDGIITVYAIFAGIGASGTQYFGIFTTQDYYEEIGWYGFAVGVALAAIGVGGVGFTYYINYFIDNYSWRISLRYCTLFVVILGLITVICTLPRTYHRNSGQQRIKAIYTKVVNEIGLTAEQAVVAINHIEGGTVKLQLIDFSLLNIKKFTIFTVSILLANFMFYAPYVHLIPHALAEGLSINDASFLLVIVGICNIILRPVMGTVVDKLSAHVVYFLSLVIFTGSTIAWIWASSYTYFCVIAALLGTCIACYMVSATMVPAELVPVHKIGSAVGFTLGLSFFVGACFAGPIMGWFFDANQSYTNVLILFAVLTGVGAILALYLLFDYMVEQRKKKEIADKAKSDIEMDAGEGKVVEAEFEGARDTTGFGTMYLTEKDLEIVMKDFVDFYRPYYVSTNNDTTISPLEYCTNHWRGKSSE